MLYKNKIKVQNILKSAVAFVFMLTLSLSTALSPLAKAEEARYTWKNLTSAPNFGYTDLRGSYVSPDGSKLFILVADNANNENLWMSEDDGVTWRKIFTQQTTIKYASFSTDGSKIVLTPRDGQHHLYISIDNGQNWTEKAMWATPASNSSVQISPDGSFLGGCSVRGGVYTTYISTDYGHTWTRKGTNNIGCPQHVFNNGTIITTAGDDKIAKSTDYGQTWTEISGFPNASFGNNGNTIFDEDRISLDGGNHWTPLSAPIPANGEAYETAVSDDGKKLFIDARRYVGSDSVMTLITSVDGGRTWHAEDIPGSYPAMSNDGSKFFRIQPSGNTITCFVGTLSTFQPVTPGAGAGGAVAPSTGSTSATPGQKSGKASGRLAETGTSTWTVGGLAVVAVAAGALVLRKRL